MTTFPAIPLFSALIVNQGVDIASAVARVIDSHWYVLGAEVRGFEHEFANYTGVDHCVSLANGTDALTLALRAVGVVAGDPVVLVANAGFYGSTAVHTIGAVPIYVDIDRASMTMSVASLEASLAQQPKAVIVTHLYGQMADMVTIAAMCRSHGVMLIEDCAQAHGANRASARVGSLGDIAAFSFYPTKNLGALGDGGAVTTSNAILAENVRALRQYGWANKYQVKTAFGCNSRLDEMQAAILRLKLPLLDQNNALRRDIARRYNEAFASLPLQLPISVGEDYVAHLYVVRTSQRVELAEHLRQRGISTDVHYPIADHCQPAYALSVELVDALPATQEACNSVLSLPCFPGLTAEQVTRVIDSVRDFFVKVEAGSC